MKRVILRVFVLQGGDVGEGRPDTVDFCRCYETDG